MQQGGLLCTFGKGFAGECVFIKIHLAAQASRLDAAKGPSEVQCSESSPPALRLLRRLLQLCVSLHTQLPEHLVWVQQGSFLGCSARGTHVRAEGLQHVQKAIAAVMTHTEVERLGRKVRVEIQRCERQRRYCAPLGQRHVMHCTWWQLLRFGPSTGCHGCSIPCRTIPTSLFGSITEVEGMVRQIRVEVQWCEQQQRYCAPQG